MTKIEHIERAVASLPEKDLVEFRAWFEAFDSGRFDEKIERDAMAGKLDRLADEALTDGRAGRIRRREPS